jgi:hypothetical protein
MNAKSVVNIGIFQHKYSIKIANLINASIKRGSGARIARLSADKQWFILFKYNTSRYLSGQFRSRIDI